MIANGGGGSGDTMHEKYICPKCGAVVDIAVPAENGIRFEFKENQE
jgi:rRNA maturation protein Nop10